MSHCEVFVAFGAVHGVGTGGTFLVASFGFTAGLTGVVIVDVVAVGPTVVLIEVFATVGVRLLLRLSLRLLLQLPLPLTFRLRLLARLDVSSRQRAAMSARAVSSLALVVASWLVSSLLVPVRLETALRSDSVVVAKLASASNVCCWKSAVSAELAEWKPAHWVVACDSHISWWAREKSTLKVGQVFWAAGRRRQSRQASVKRPVCRMVL